MAIPFTQFLRPDGRQTEVSIERSAEVEAKAQVIIARGLRFECEVLTTGHVSLTITDPEEGDLAIELCNNGEAVPAAVDRLIEQFEAGPRHAAENRLDEMLRVGAERFLDRMAR